MYGKFGGALQVTDHIADARPPEIGHKMVDSFFREYAGRTFGDGLLRIHTAESAIEANRRCARLIPDSSGMVSCFGFDWMGRDLAVDVRSGRELSVVMFEPGAAEIAQSDIPFLEFCDIADDAVAPDVFGTWMEVRGSSRPLAFSECAGYDVPLFLGGTDDIRNMSRMSVEIYWELCIQLASKAMDLPKGSSISQIIIRDER
jgi:hypothetical protein